MMSKIYKILSLVAFLFAFGWIGAQTVSGKVTDPDGLGVPGATVVVKGTTNTTDTDIDGNFTLNDVASDATLVITAPELDAKEIAVGGQSTIAVAMLRPQAQDDKILKEVVAIGYGSTKKKDATGSMAVIGVDDFNKGITSSPDQLLQGKIAGVNVTSSSGEPGGGSSITIRGVGSIRAGNGPLYVIDGVPIVIEASPGGSNVGDIGSSAARNPLNFINSADIETITILKDASATAIYGSRGANGVILVTTKKGKRGKNNLNFNVTTSWGTVARKLNILDADSFASASTPTNNFGNKVDAWDEITKTSFTKEYGLSYSGGADNHSYRVSLGALNQEGVLRNSELNKYTLNGNFVQKFFEDDLLTIETNFGASYIKDIGNANSDNVGFQGNLLLSALKWNPTRSFYNTDGSYFQTNELRNPLALLDYYTDNTKTTRVYGNISATLKIVKGLSYKFLYGIDNSNSKRNVALSSLFNENLILGRGALGIQNINNKYYLLQNTLQYDTKITDNLTVNAVLGASYEKTTFYGEYNTVRDFTNITDQDEYIKNQFLGKRRDYAEQRSKTGVPTSLQSYFARGIFTYADKYILTGTMRADGSSRFGSNNQFGYFPSAAFAWKIDKEGFLPESINELKLRLGWGITGNQDFDPLASRRVYEYVGLNNALSLIQADNPDLKWETTTSYNLGLDFRINRRLSGSVDVFRRETKDILNRVQVAVPAPAAKVWVNLKDAKIINSGVELSLNYDVIQSEDFNWTVGGNIAFLKNTVNTRAYVITGAINGQGLSQVNSQLIYDDQPSFAFYLPIFDGFNANGSEKYKDLNGDGVGSTSFAEPGKGDYAFLGSPNPDYTVGLSTSLSYKNWDMVISGYGAYGQKLYNNTANALFNASSFKQGNNVTSNVLTEGDFGSTNPSLAASSRYLESGDFFRLANATIGYTFKGGENGFVKWVNTLRLFVTAQNIFVITPYSGFDPEVNINKEVDGVASRGIDYSAYPKARTYSIGLNVNF